MLVFWNHGLVFFAVPKTATTSIEDHLAPDASLILRDPPGFKHMPAYEYEKLLKPKLDSLNGSELKSLAVMRDPVDWLGSWYRYRARDDLRGHPNSTAGISFDAFVGAYMSDDPPPFARVGSQAEFVARADGRIFMDYIFPYEDMGALERFFAKRLGREVRFPRRNISPEMQLCLSPEIRTSLEEFAARDFRLHAHVASGAMGAP